MKGHKEPHPIPTVMSLDLYLTNSLRVLLLQMPY